MCSNQLSYRPERNSTTVHLACNQQQLQKVRRALKAEQQTELARLRAKRDTDDVRLTEDGRGPKTDVYSPERR